MNLPVDQILVQLGFAGAILILWWFDRKDIQKKDADAAKERQAREDADRESRRKESEEMRLVLQNHLSSLIGEDIKSRENLAVAVTKLADAENNRERVCSTIEGELTTPIRFGAS